ncbi:MAG: rhomboid family intramembrane serine protease [Armatimonadetes bacterium]|nr:rhomboid family intramembrane serine protease [Armatimonadota bacterium]
MTAWLDTDHPRSRSPLATWSLILVTGAVYLALLFLPLSYGDVVRVGVLAERPHLPGLLLASFFHVSGFHFLFNATLLWLLGRDVEDVFGPLGFLVLYLLVGGAAHLAQVGAMQLFLPAAGGLPILGASGAVSGVMGAFAGRFPRERIVLGGESGNSSPTSPGFRAAWIWGLWIAYAVAGMVWSAWTGEMESGVWGHGAGFLLGLAVATLAPRRGGPDRESNRPGGRDRNAPSGGEGSRKRGAKEGLARADALAADSRHAEARAHAKETLRRALERRNPEDAYRAYRWLEEREGRTAIPPERRLEVAGLLENTGEPERAMELIQALLPEAPPETAASALLAAARIFAGPLNRPERAEESLRIIESRYPRTRAGLLAAAERKRLKSIQKTDK